MDRIRALVSSVTIIAPCLTPPIRSFRFIPPMPWCRRVAPKHRCAWGLIPCSSGSRPRCSGRGPLEALETFCTTVVDAVQDAVPVIKVQSACFERHGADGVAVLGRVIEHVHDRGLQTILDVKRGDIGISAAHYAAAVGRTGAAWLTASPYLGMETLEPYLEAGLGVFALVRTSNPGSDPLQRLELTDGRRVCDAVADAVARCGVGWMGQSGFSALGAVVGATKPAELAGLRARMPEQIFLIPGFGAQGGGVEDVRPCFAGHPGGAIVTASRSVIYAGAETTDWPDAVAHAANELAASIQPLQVMA